MVTYFISFVTKKPSHEVTGHIDSGFGHTTCEARAGTKPQDALDSMLIKVAQQFGIEQNMIHVIQFNQV